MAAVITTRAVAGDDLDDLAALFGRQRTSRRCWCTAFCSTRREFSVGWFGGGNRRRFEALAVTSAVPMGVLATVAGDAVGWGGCGPRSRYGSSADVQKMIIANRPTEEDADAVWLLPCLLVRADHRGEGISHALVAAAVELARRSSAPAIEGWPLAASAERSADAFVGREGLFAELGFLQAGRPTADRVIMRLDLNP